MSLFCSVCNNPTPLGVNQCKVCNNGFVSQLCCSTCGYRVDRGAASCTRCPERPQTQESQTQTSMQRVEHLDSLSTFLGPSRGDALRELSLARGRHMSDVGVFGAHSDVTIPLDVMVVFADISDAIQVVLKLSSRLMTLSPSDRTVSTVRACRSLALALQEELETRRGR